ncbi:MAG: hypothetical protein WA941_05410 [Nitrososphaeraceae archaeon]
MKDIGFAQAAKCTSLILIVCSVFLSTSFIEKKWVPETGSRPIFAQTNSVQADTVQGSESINAANVTIKEYSVPTGSRPHDVAPMYNLTNDGDLASSPVDATRLVYCSAFR